jgi:hypothetical protein
MTRNTESPDAQQVNFQSDERWFPSDPNSAHRENWAQGLGKLLFPALATVDATLVGAFPGGERAFFGRTAERLEAYARIATGAAFLSAASPGAAWERTFGESLQLTLVRGTDPAHPGFWGFPRDRDQRIVEMAGIAAAIGFAPGLFWEPLARSEQDRVANWLTSINHAAPNTNNWILFRIFTNAVLHRIGHGSKNDPSETDWAKVDALYLGDGWYQDGAQAGACDLYNPWGFHLYSLYCVHLHPAMPEARRASILQRALELAPALEALQSPEGLILPFGRSLTYRFASAAFWGALALAGADGPAGHWRALAARQLAWWAGQPIRDSQGRLTVGFQRANQNVAEHYNSSGGAYFALHAFAPLALPGSHAFWAETTAAVKPGASAASDVLTIGPARMQVCADRERDHHWAICDGQTASWPLRGHAEKYAKFSYSCRHGFQVSGGARGLVRLGIDNTLAVSEGDEYWKLRDGPEIMACPCEDGLRSEWVLPGWLRVRTTQRIVDGMAWREHQIDVDRELELVEGGWCFPIDELRADEDGRSETLVQGEATLSRPGAWFSAIWDAGEVTRRSEIVFPEPNLNPLHAVCAIPVLREKLLPGSYQRHTWVAGYGHHSGKR